MVVVVVGGYLSHVFVIFFLTAQNRSIFFLTDNLRMLHLVEFIYLVFTCILGESCRRRLRRFVVVFV